MAEIQHVTFPAALPTNRVKRALKVALGKIISLVNPMMRMAVERGDLPDSPTAAQKLVLAAFVAKCLKEQTPEKLTELQTWLWRSGQAVTFHAAASNRFQTWWLDTHSKILDDITSAQQDMNEPFTLCEIGCGSGLILRDIRKRKTANFSRYIGLDLSPKQIETNKAEATENPDFSGIEYVAADAREWIPKNIQQGWVILTNAGVMEYWTQEQLRSFFQSIESTPGCMLALIEPLGEDFDPDVETQSRPYHFEQSFSHPYPQLLEQHGWSVVSRKAAEVGGLRWILLCARNA